MRASTIMWVVLIVAVGVSMFLLKYKVQALEEELAAKQERIERDQDAIRVLDAEWAYFNDPERLRRLSAGHLGFVQPTTENIKSFADLPFREGPIPYAGEIKSPPNKALSADQQFDNGPRADNSSAAPATKHLSVGPAIFARIQRYLMPARAEGRIQTEGAR